MTPQRAHHLGVNPADVRITSQSNRHGGEWIASVDVDGRERVLASFGQSGIFAACRWLADLRRLACS